MNVYEWCIETLLARQRQAFCRVRDIRRIELFDGPTKNFDYVVRTPDGGLLLEIKGRQFPTSGGGVWENWVTAEDLDALETWIARFGQGFRGLLVFVYRHRDPSVPPGRAWTPFDVDGTPYGIVACDVAEYRSLCRQRSASWGTVTVRRREFTQLVRPFSEFLPPGTVDPRPTADNDATDAEDADVGDWFPAGTLNNSTTSSGPRRK